MADDFDGIDGEFGDDFFDDPDIPLDIDDADGLVEVLNDYEFASGQFEFTIEMDDGSSVTISVDLDAMYELYDILEDLDLDFYMSYGED